MAKLKNNYVIRNSGSCAQNISSLLASNSLKRWIMILFLFYKLDYMDYYCYGSSSSGSSNSNTAILNNENGKEIGTEKSCFKKQFIIYIFYISFCFLK